MNSSMTAELARFALGLEWRALPASIVRETRLILLDSIGCALGAASTDKGRMNVALARKLGGPPDASIIGMGGKVACTNAALANGELILTLDFSNIVGGGHDGAYVIPAVLATAESSGASGRELIMSTAVGLEIAARLARALGQHNTTPAAVLRARAEGTGVSGNAYANFGAAAGSGRLLKLDEERLTHALGIAGHLCMVLSYRRWSHSDRGHMTKYGVPGWQSTGAVVATMLAEMGYLGDTTILDHPDKGFAYVAGYPTWHPEEVMADLGSAWCFNVKLHYKPYPCCGVFHGPLDCFYHIIDTHKLGPEDIDSVVAYFRGHMDSPLFSKKTVESISDAQFNAGHVFGAAAHRIPRGVEWYDPDTMTHPGIRSFGQKVICRTHPEYGKTLQGDPLSALSKVEVVARGKTYAHEILYRRGSAGTEAAMSEADLVDKFRHNAARVLTKRKTERAIRTLLQLEEVDNIADLMREVTL